MRDLDFCQDPRAMFEYGVISRRGARDNMSDFGVEIILIHVPSSKVRKFPGTFYNHKYVESLCEWIRGFPKNKEGITIDKLNYYYTCGEVELLKKAE